MASKKRVRIIKKIREAAGVWRFISLRRIGSRYVWDKRPGYFFVEWWEGSKRKRELAGTTPSEAAEAQRRKQNELLGALLSKGHKAPDSEETSFTPIAEALTAFLDHVRVHSPDKPKTLQRYQKVLQHFERHLGKRRFIEAITRADIDDFKTKRSGEKSQQHNRIITARTIHRELRMNRPFWCPGSRERRASRAVFVDSGAARRLIPDHWLIIQQAELGEQSKQLQISDGGHPVAAAGPCL
jgi:hypothetical protein